MTKCPLCFHTLPPDSVSWMATAGMTAVDEIASGYAGFEVTSRQIVNARRKRRGELVPTRTEVEHKLGCAVEEVCPDCHHPLPANWRDNDTVCVAMAGARATGKTIYIAVLVKALQTLGERLDKVVEPFDDHTAESYRQVYETTLYGQRRMLPPTMTRNTQVRGDTDHATLILRLGRVDGRSQLLVIRDVAGEDLHKRANAAARWTEFFGHADGVLFMFDPLKVQSIATLLRGRTPPLAPDTVQPLTVLQTVLSMIGTNSTKLAVVLSKFDALHELRSPPGSEWSAVMNNPGAAFSRDPGLSETHYNEDDGELVDAEVRSLLTLLQAKSIVDAVNAPHTGARLNPRFFAVSALGALPAETRVHDGGISPFRCVDPIRWILHGAGVWR
ncbi:TRAFAC clade GTPase domain-containing protein [Nocardia takedensis]|uniref:TRAFAC clade GTPase domain-containing protein n=1 Tax=Nocardia takedensis TaxID=259390 RepID=UPI003F77293D